MHEYDTVLKSLLQNSPNSILQTLAGVKVDGWLNVELPEVMQTRVDLLGESSSLGLVHLELQSTNDRHMALRMAEYALRVYRKFEILPKQIVLYVGQERARMPTELRSPQHSFRYDLIDLRNTDAQPLLSSAHLADNVLAILGV
jgi:predicted transposase YdaD